ncbi:UNVERIFIED_CONTAM: hypothetical protein NCL1_48793 [Trichonephila clavipes]
MKYLKALDESFCCIPNASQPNALKCIVSVPPFSSNVLHVSSSSDGTQEYIRQLQLLWMQDSVVLLIRCGVTTIAGASNTGEDIVPTCSRSLACAMDDNARNSLSL